jgi:two-component system, NarL family, nitrate/nitrite response regulator NarL
VGGQAIAMKILLADDHALFRDALIGYIERAQPGVRITSVGDLPSARQVLDNDPNYDLVLLDWQMPGVSSLQDFQDMVLAYGQVKFALMSGVVEEHEAAAALKMGLWGYFPKTLPGRALVDGIGRVLKGEKYVPLIKGSARLQSSYQDNRLFYRADQPSERMLHLTERERQVTQLLGSGLRNDEIAIRLGITLATVKLHVRNSFKKMGVRNRTEAVLKAKKIGILHD